MLRTIFPAAVQVVVAEDWMWSSAVYTAEEQAIQEAGEARKSEFRAGRNSAHVALRNLGANRFVVRKGLQREPLWPTGYTGSISHTIGHCSVVVTRQCDFSGIGHDVELRTPLEPAVLNRICSRRERQQVIDFSDFPVPICKLFFSAKESIYKSYFLLCHHKLGFEDVEIDFDLVGQSWSAIILKPATNPGVDLRSLNGQFRYDERYIYTGVFHQ